MIRRILLAFALLLCGLVGAQAASEGFTVANCLAALANPYTANGFNAITVDVNGNTCVVGTLTTATPAAGAGNSGYPPGALATTGSATGTTAGTTASIGAAAGKFSYLCGFTVSPGSATAAITIATTVTGGANTFTESVGAPVTAAGTTGVSFTRSFTPCIQGTAVNTAINVAAGALGAGGVNQSVYAWGYVQ